mgnify:CR=1 FL=1
MADDQNPQLPLTPPPGGDGGGPNAGNIQPINIEEEMRRSYLDYAMSVIVARALQGLGAALTAPNALALIATNFPVGKPRNSAMAVYGAMSALGITKR